MYLGINDQPQDRARFKALEDMACAPVTLRNALPVHIIVTHVSKNHNVIRKLGQLDPHGLLSVAPGILEDGDCLHFRYGNQHGENYLVSPSIIYNKMHIDITVGAVAATDGGWHRDIHPNGDVSSIRLHNLLPWPVYILYRGKVVGWIKGNRALKGPYLESNFAAPFIYFDNNNMGLKLNDKFEVQVDNSQYPGVPIKLYGFSIKDRNIAEVFIGQNTVEFNETRYPETYAYSLGDDNYPRGYNAIGTDEHRSFSKRSRVPVARFKMLSDFNVMSV